MQKPGIPRQVSSWQHSPADVTKRENPKWKGKTRRKSGKNDGKEKQKEESKNMKIKNTSEETINRGAQKMIVT